MRSRKGRTDKASRKRAAHSARAVAGVAANLLATKVLGPAGKLVTVSIGQLVKHAGGLVAERRERRIELFHQELLASAQKDERRKLVEEITSDSEAAHDYASILEKVWEDDEEAKTGVYASLFRFLLSRAIDARTRLHLVRTVRELAAADLELLKTALRIGGPWPEPATTVDPAGFVHVAPPSPARDAHYRMQEQFLGESDALTLAGIQRLEHAGFIRRVPVYGGDRVDVTPLGRLLLEALTAQQHPGG